jgi:hypothetical protein
MPPWKLTGVDVNRTIANNSCLALGIFSIFAGLGLSEQPIALAQSCNYFAGTAVNGKSVNVDLCSISIPSDRSVDFVYYLGSERVQSQANCPNGTWTTFPERQLNRPQSAATQRMLNVVCSYRESQTTTAFVFDPPSNVRRSPNGAILCSLKTRRSINIYGAIGSWYYTDACGEVGVIDASQLKF